jgi:nucleotide-binding universal stress UspA family protein
MFNRILLAVDNGSAGPVTVTYAGALARQSGAVVRVVHVNELLIGGRGFAAETELEAMAVVDDAVAALRGAGVQADGVHFLANCFTTANRIVEAAQEWGADVIMVGSTRRRFLRRSLGKGLRERITSLTCLPVLTGPAPLRVAGHLRVADLTGQPADTTRVESIV